MKAQHLKNSILQLAICGKLVEQRAEEGTARELLEQIKAEKEQLIKDKKIKKSKPLPKITEEEIPFEIPESWEWVRLKDIVCNNGQEKPQYKFSYIDIGSIDNVHQKLNQKENIIEAKDAPSRARKIVKHGDIIYSTVRPYLHNMCIIDKEFGFKPIASTGFAVMSCLGELYNRYLFFYLMSPTFDNYVNASENARGATYPAINDDRLYRAIVPVPPLEEQHRIVAKIEEILPYIDQYDKAYMKLEIFNKKFPEDMKKSILQMAVQGKLVEQRPEEGTADELYEKIIAEKAQLIKDGKIKREKPSSEITEDEIPFEIPSSWKWVRLNDLCAKISSGSTPSGGRNVYKEEGIKFLRSKNIYNDGIRYEGIVYISEELNKKGSIVKAKDILLNITGGSIGRCAIVTDDFDIANINQHVMIIRGVNLGLRFWIHNIIISPYIQSKIMDVQVGVSREGLSAEKLKNFLIPLPPLEEQKRIVTKIKEILPYCNQLIK